MKLKKKKNRISFGIIWEKAFPNNQKTNEVAQTGSGNEHQS